MVFSIINLNGCMTAVTVVDASSSTVTSTGEVLIDTIDLITPDIFDED